MERKRTKSKGRERIKKHFGRINFSLPLLSSHIFLLSQMHYSTTFFSFFFTSETRLLTFLPLLSSKDWKIMHFGRSKESFSLLATTSKRKREMHVFLLSCLFLFQGWKIKKRDHRFDDASRDERR